MSVRVRTQVCRGRTCWPCRASECLTARAAAPRPRDHSHPRLTALLTCLDLVLCFFLVSIWRYLWSHFRIVSVSVWCDIFKKLVIFLLLFFFLGWTTPTAKTVALGGQGKGQMGILFSSASSICPVNVVLNFLLLFGWKTKKQTRLVVFL